MKETIFPTSFMKWNSAVCSRVFQLLQELILSRLSVDKCTLFHMYLSSKGVGRLFPAQNHLDIQNITHRPYKMSSLKISLPRASAAT